MAVPTFRDLLGLGRADEDEGQRSITVDPRDMTMRVVGYSPSEVSDILATYREHQTLMLDLLKQMQSQADAVRYQPDGDPL